MQKPLRCVRKQSTYVHFPAIAKKKPTRKFLHAIKLACHRHDLPSHIKAAALVTGVSSVHYVPATAGATHGFLFQNHLPQPENNQEQYGWLEPEYESGSFVAEA